MPKTKIGYLRKLLAEMKSVLIAFSGGIDSSLLLKVALEVLGAENVLAVTASSKLYPAEETGYAKKLARSLSANHIILTTDTLKNQRFSANPPDRCYYCKKELFSELRRIADQKGLAYVIDGSNADDYQDFRPGIKAGQEMGVKSPLREAGLTKKEIRKTARRQGLPNWNKPSMPCLSSRFPYGDLITSPKLRQVEEAERFLRLLGFGETRVRHHGDTARIEVTEKAIKKVVSPLLRKKIAAKLTSLGFNYVALDLQGFRSGSMNEVLAKEILNR